MGAVLTPALIGVAEAGHLPNASSFCGRCESVCPVKIPLPKMMRHWRERQFAQRQVAPGYRSGLKLWVWVARRPALYHALVEVKARLLGRLGARRGRFRALPLAGGWTGQRDMPAPEGRSFHALWAERQRARLSSARRHPRRHPRPGSRPALSVAWRPAASPARVAVRIAATSFRRGRPRSTRRVGSSCSSPWPRRCRRPSRASPLIGEAPAEIARLSRRRKPAGRDQGRAPIPRSTNCPGPSGFC